MAGAPTWPAAGRQRLRRRASALRGLAGVIEGVLLWITVAMISRTETPERWAGVFFTAQTGAQLLLAIALAVWIMPAFGATGGFVAITVCLRSASSRR